MEVSIHGARILAVFEDIPLFGTVSITQTITAAWLVMVLLSGLCIWLGSGLRVTNISRKQAAAELAYNAIVTFVRNNMGTGFDHYIPLVATLFATSVLSNLISLLGIWSPTADLMTELAWGLVVFTLITYQKLKSSGLRKYLGSFLDPIPLLLPVNILSEGFTPVSMACRHFGNILSGTVISTLVYAALAALNNVLFHWLGSSVYVGVFVAILGFSLFLSGKRTGKKLSIVLGASAAVLGVLGAATALGLAYPWLTIGIPAIPSLYFDWFSGCIQAFIFCTLTTLFIKQAAGTETEAASLHPKTNLF